MAGVSGKVCLKGKFRQMDACDECAPECSLFADPSLDASQTYSDIEEDQDAAKEGELKKSTKKFVMFML
jgi:hypothetical protein